MNILIYTLVVFVLWIIILGKFFLKNLKNHFLLVSIGLIIAFLVEITLIFLGFFEHNIYPQILGIPLIVFILYFFYFSFVYGFSEYFYQKFKKNLYYLIFLGGFLFGFLFDITAMNLGYWAHLINPKIFEVNIFAPFAEGFMILGIFYITNFFKRIF